MLTGGVGALGRTLSISSRVRIPPFEPDEYVEQSLMALENDNGYCLASISWI